MGKRQGLQMHPREEKSPALVPGQGIRKYNTLERRGLNCLDQDVWVGFGGMGMDGEWLFHASSRARYGEHQIK